MDKARKREVRDEWRAKQRAQARERFPLPPEKLRDLFDTLDVQLPLHGCDHSRRLTHAWIESRDYDAAAICTWLDENGGFCDCEVVANSKQHFLEAIYDVP
jgi:hypothetical protein